MDGWGLCVRVDAGRPRIWSHNGLPWTGAMSGIAAGLEQLGRDVVLDGEAVCQLPDGRSDFRAHGARMAAGVRCSGPSTS
ncbi:hypothetical protein [Enterovirga sp. CN4-39]|uniref:hypothetical protein n=1 Tax=Enterovirga sp. CN4-39 TaxID=3400910 RepID=UPI003BFD3C5B